MDRRYANPVLVTGEDAQPLERIPFEQRVSETTGLEFDERRLQRLIFENSGAVPDSRYRAGVRPGFALGARGSDGGWADRSTPRQSEGIPDDRGDEALAQPGS